MENFFKKMFEFSKEFEKVDETQVLREYKSEGDIDKDLTYFQELRDSNTFGDGVDIIGELLISDCFTGKEALEILEKYRKIPFSKYSISMFFSDLPTLDERKQEIINKLEKLFEEL